MSARVTEVSGAKSSPRALRTQSALIAAGRRLFGERVVDAVTVDEIVDAANVGKGSFYNHFADRSALAKAVSDDIRQQIETIIAATNSGIDDAAVRMARAQCTYYKYALDEQERSKFLVQTHSGSDSLSSPLNQGLKEDIRSGIVTGRFSVPTIEATVVFVQGITQNTFLQLVQEQDWKLTVRLSQQICTMLLRGLGVEAKEADLIATKASNDILGRQPIR